MATVHEADQPAEAVVDKGLKTGALGLISTIVMGVASTAPAYSLAATLGFIALVGGIGFHAPLIALAAFIPMLLCSIAYSEMNKADPDCGTTFTWATRAFGPKTGWAGGWAIVAADVLVMASLAQVAGQYVFFLVQGPNSAIGSNAASGWVLLVGVLWIAAMTVICYIGIEVSANFQKILLGVEIVMLVILSITALVKVFSSNHPAVSVRPEVSWFLPTNLPLSAFVGGLILMLFIYWGWDTAVAVNEETKDKTRTPGRAAIASTVILLLTYVLIILAAQSYSGIGTTGIGLQNAAHTSDVLSVLGGSVFGTTGFGSFVARLLFLMILSSAAASTQTTILPTARTTLSMAAYKAFPAAFAKISPRFLTPTVSTIAMGAASILLYIPMNYISKGNAIVDAVTAIGLYIAFYYGLTAFSCVWYYRKTLFQSQHNLWMRGILPLAGGLIMYIAGGIALQSDWVPFNSYTTWLIPGVEWRVGGVFLIAIFAALAGVIVGIYQWATAPAFFRKETLTRATPTLVPDVD
ncbi:MAG TPA: APC family permease [Streptosporangiaceae bacterium]|nr:APC family permease [Streptosporangiaceae bacterium]